MTLVQTVATELANAPLPLYPIRRLTAHADRDTIDRVLIGWIRDGLILIDVHLDAAVILDRDRLAALAVEATRAAQ